jgi:hypothetical protein
LFPNGISLARVIELIDYSLLITLDPSIVTRGERVGVAGIYHNLSAIVMPNPE